MIKCKHISQGECLGFFKALNKNWAHCLENYKDVFLNRLLSTKFKKSCVHCSIMDNLKESAVHFPFD